MPLIPCPPVVMWVVILNARTAEDAATMDAPSGLPVRVLLEGNVRLPEQAFLRCRDLKTARVALGAGRAAFLQVRAWAQEVHDA